MTPAVSRRQIVLAAASVGLLLSAPTAAAAQDRYPDRLIKIIVPFPAGGTPDTLARIVADKLQSKWGKPVIVENRPGATGNIGAEAVAKAEPDGYTLLLAPPPPLAVNQHLFDNLRFDPAAWGEFVAEIEAFLATPTATIAPDFQLDDLTLRERQVLEFIAQGLDNNHIAAKLGISEKTVRNHVSMVLAKLGLHSRLQAAVRAREAGFGHKA